MQRLEYLYSLTSPLPNAVLKQWPKGDIRQYWGENPGLYSAGMDDFHVYTGGHMGIDLATFHRDPVHAAHSGLVVIINNNSKDARNHQGGLEVWITSPEHDGEEPGNSRIQTVYCHLDEITVALGQKVQQGDIIGYEGNTGFIVSGGVKYWGDAPEGKGTHLHFGLYEDIKRNGVWQRRYDNPLRDSSDPLPYISETSAQPRGDLSGFMVVINNMLRYLNRLGD